MRDMGARPLSRPRSALPVKTTAPRSRASARCCGGATRPSSSHRRRVVSPRRVRGLRARRGPARRATVLAVTPFVDDERPCGRRSTQRRVLTLGGDRGDVVTAGVYVVPARARARSPAGLAGCASTWRGWWRAASRLRRGDRARDRRDPRHRRDAGGRMAAQHRGAPRLRRACRASGAWGPLPGPMKQDLDHAVLGHLPRAGASPGRESDDAEILRLAGKHWRPRSAGRAQDAEGRCRSRRGPAGVSSCASAWRRSAG